MTREEAIRTLCAIDVPIGNCALIDEEVHEAISMAIETLSQPHIPSNLDEAAEEWARSVYGNPGKSAVSISGAYGFKAGAEWMIKQGISAESEVCKLAERAWVKPINEKQFERDVYDNFVSGDKVIVQIRKR